MEFRDIGIQGFLDFRDTCSKCSMILGIVPGDPLPGRCHWVTRDGGHTADTADTETRKQTPFCALDLLHVIVKWLACNCLLGKQGNEAAKGCPEIWKFAYDRQNIFEIALKLFRL